MTAPAKYRQFPSRLKYEKDGEKTDPSDVTGEKRWEEKILSLQSLSRLESQWQSPEEKEAEKGSTLKVSTLKGRLLHVLDCHLVKFNSIPRSLVDLKYYGFVASLTCCYC